MTLPFTKRAAEIYAPVDAAGNIRSPLLQDAAVHGTEIERLLLGLAADNLDIDFPFGFIRATNSDSGDPNAITATTNFAIPTGDHGALIALNIVADNTGAATVEFNDDGALDIKGASGEAVKAGDLKAGMVIAGYVSSGDFRLLNDFGVQFLKATNTGGTNAITATTPTPVPSDDGAALIVLPIAEDNTASPVTVSFNGADLLTIKDVAGEDIPVGGLLDGMNVAGYVSGSNFRLVTDYSSAVHQQAAKAWAESPEDDPVETVYGGDGSTTFSALHHAAKAGAFSASAATDRDFIENHLISYVTDDDESVTVVVATTMIAGEGTDPYDHVTLELVTP